MDGEGNMESNEVEGLHKDYRLFWAYGDEGLLPWTTEGMFWWIKHVKFIRFVHSPDGDLLAGLAILDPEPTWAYTIVMPTFTLPKTTCFPHNHSILACRWNPGKHLYGPSICSWLDSGTCTLQDKILIITFLPINGLATNAIIMYKATTLDINPGVILWKQNNLFSSVSLQWSEYKWFLLVVSGTLSANSSEEMQPKGLLSTGLEWGVHHGCAA